MNSDEMRRIMVLLEGDADVIEEGPRGFRGGLRGAWQGYKQRKEMFGEWKEFLRKYRRRGNYEDLKDWLRIKKYRIPEEKLDQLLAQSNIHAHAGDSRIEDSNISRFFSGVGYYKDVAAAGVDMPADTPPAGQAHPAAQDAPAAASKAQAARTEPDQPAAAASVTPKGAALTPEEQRMFAYFLANPGQVGNDDRRALYAAAERAGIVPPAAAPKSKTA